MKQFVFGNMTFAVGAALALLAGSAEAIVLNNGIPIGTRGHFSADVLTGGAIRGNTSFTTRPSNSQELITLNIIGDYRTFVDPGIDGQGFELQGSEPVIIEQPTEFSPNRNFTVRSFGEFIGANGNTVGWEVTSILVPRGKSVQTTIVVRGGEPFGEPVGPLRVYQYLDAEGPDSGDVVDVVPVLGLPPTIRLLNDITLFGVQLGGIDSDFDNSVFRGSAVDSFDRIREQIFGLSLPPVAIPTTITNLPTFNHPRLGVVRGPGDAVSVLAWDVDPTTAGLVAAVVNNSVSGVDAPPDQPVDEDFICDDPDEEDCDGDPRPAEPAREQFSCRTAGCVVPVTCNLPTSCETQTSILVFPESVRLNDRSVTRAQRRVRFAAAVTNIPPNETVTVRPRLTKRGRSILRANRNKTIRGVMAIRNSITGDLFSRTRVRIRLK